MLDVDIVINTGVLDGFMNGFSAKSKKAMDTAFRVEGFRLRPVVQEELSSGIGPSKSALTRAEAKHPGGEALSAFGMGSRIIGYSVTPKPRDIELRVGFTQWITRAPSKSKGRRTNIVTVVSGGTHRIDRKAQRVIAGRLRRRLFEPVQRPRKDGRIRKPKHPGRYHWADLSIMIPPVGAVVNWPERDFVSQILVKERSKIINNIRNNYARKLLGERI